VKSVSAKKKRRRFLMRRKRTIDPSIVVDYKNPDMLKRFITDRGKIIPRRISGATADQQRVITVAVKRARFLALLPYSMGHRPERGFAGEMQMIAQSFATTSFRGRRDMPQRGDRPGGDRPSGDRYAPRERSAAPEGQDSFGEDE
jgi:small subunit ribosomal protein S18